MCCSLFDYYFDSHDCFSCQKPLTIVFSKVMANYFDWKVGSAGEACLNSAISDSDSSEAAAASIR